MGRYNKRMKTDVTLAAFGRPTTGNAAYAFRYAAESDDDT